MSIAPGNEFDEELRKLMIAYLKCLRNDLRELNARLTSIRKKASKEFRESNEDIGILNSMFFSATASDTASMVASAYNGQVEVLYQRGVLLKSDVDSLKLFDRGN